MPSVRLGKHKVLEVRRNSEEQPKKGDLTATLKETLPTTNDNDNLHSSMAHERMQNFPCQPNGLLRSRPDLQKKFQTQVRMAWAMVG